MIAERPEGEKAQDLPELRKVPQTLAAGWGGVGTVAACMSMDALAEPMAMFLRSDAYSADMADFEASDLEAPRRVPGPDVPEPFRRLLALIEETPDRLDARHAIDLLQAAGLASEFDDLFRHASDLGLNVNVIAVIVLAGLLGGPLGEYLSKETQSAVASLQDHAQQATEAIREMGRHGIALARIADSPVAREVLRPDQARDIREMLERFARFRDLLDHLQDCARRAAERLEKAGARRGGAIA